MKRSRLRLYVALLAAASPTCFGQWSYFLVDKTMAGPPSQNWTTSNSLGTDMLTNAPNPHNGGEVRAVISGTSQYDFQIYLSAYDCYNGCLLGGASNFTSGYQVMFLIGGGIQLYSTWPNFNTGSAPLTYLSSASSPALQAGTPVRAVVRPDPAGGVDIIGYVNNSLVLFYHDTSAQAISSNSLGFNFPDGTATDYVSEGDVAGLYSGTPSSISESSIGVSTTTNSVDLQWPASSEPNGPGVYGYLISRNGQPLTTTPVTCTCYSDLTTIPNSTYTYTITAVDYHWNTVGTNITVNTPLIPSKGPYPSATPNGYRTGVQPTGTYWGTTNENIDVMSGNLSFSVPLLKAQARTSWTVPFNLSYNSQAWRQDSGGAWALAGDVGEGFGWRLLAGAITPVVSGQTISFYLFTDASGAEYRLDQNNNNIWSSVDSVYVYYDANLDILHFRDGSRWLMQCVSSASEFDSGVMYPTTMEDTNGNQILISYNAGAGSQSKNSSSRINVIQDVRSTTSNSSTFSFAYNSDSPVPHLTSIANSISTGEQYTFSYAENQTVSSPINGQSFGETTFLNSTTVNGLGVVTSFSYDGSGELTQTVLPTGGYLKWDYDTVTYSGGISFREVNHRYLSKDGTTGSQTTYTLSHESSVSTPVHQYTQLADPSGTGEKYWAIGQSGVGMGLVTEYQGIQMPGSVVKAQNNFTWSLDGVGNSYISSTQATLDPGQSYQAQSQTTQSVDNYGNVTQVNYYNYGNLSSPYRTYNYSYLNSSAYTAIYIFNRLSNASVTSGGTNYTLASNTYDYSTQPYCWYTTVPNPSSNWDANYASITTRGDVTQSTTPSGVSSSCYNQLGVNTSVTTNGVTANVTTSNSNNYAAPSQLSVGSLSTSLSWSSFLGLTNDTGPNGDSSSTYYDEFARQTSTTSPFGATTSYAYSSAPYTSSNPEIITTSTSASSGTRWSSSTLDGLGRAITVKSGYGSTTTSQVDTTYGSCACSPAGKMMAQSLPHAPGASVAWTTYTYDGIGRTISVLAPDGASTTTYLYQGNTVQVTDPAGKWKLFTMDVMGNLTQVTEPNPSDGAPPAQPTFPPTFSVAPGTYGSTQTVLLSSATSGATIYYTTDGSTPSQSSTQYHSGISVSSTTTINAIAYAGGMATSAISTGVYTISSGGGGGGASWYNNSWSYRKAITINSSQVSGSSSLTNFPVLISITDSNLASSAQSNGNDILFTDSTGTNKLNHEIESYTSSNGQLVAWVQAPSLSPSSNTTLYMYYGNSSASNQQNAAGAWNSNYVGVYHLTAPSTAGLADSTSHANNASNPGGGLNTASGLFGGAVQNPGNYWAYLDIPGQTYNELGGASGTVSVWAYATAAGTYANLATKGSSYDFSLEIPFGGGGGYLEWGGQGNYTSGITLATGTWYYVTLTMNASTNALTLYINGVAQNTLTLSGYTGKTGDIEMFSGFGTNYFTGSEAELRMSNVTLSPSWILTEYNNESSPGTFSSVGSQQTQGGGGSYPTPVGMPTFDPAPGTYNTSVSVTLSSSTSGASIRYTTNGSTPSETAGTLYSGPFTLNSTTTIKAIAYESGMADSEISTVTFTISSSSGGSNYLTYYTYDGWNNVTQVSMPRPTGTQTRSFTYSGKFLTSATNPENGTVNYTYNSYFKVATKTDAKGQAMVYSYDQYARLTEVQKYPNGTSGNEDTCQRELYYYGDVEGGNPWNTNYSQYASGRLSGIQYYTPLPQGGGCTTVQEQYSYLQAGAKTNKGLVITRSTGAVDLESSYTYDNEGKMLTVQYPGSSNGTAGPSLTYAYDSMGRLNTLTDVGNSVNAITSTSYDPANRLLQISGNAYSETRSYNTMGQLTGLSNNSVNITYAYSSNQNNGKITSQTDNISGETVVYAYDALNRLASAAATSNSWGQSYGYDGFGNLTDQTVTAGTAPSLTTTYNASTNQQSGDCADANGNISPCGAGMGYSYDVKNRIVWVPGGTPYGTAYGYAPNSKRIWRGAENIVNGTFQVTLDEITFWSVSGQKLATYNLSFSSSPVSYSIATSNYYFGRKMVKNGAGYVGADRLGSIGHFYPWGQEKPSSTTNGTEKFTGYFRDAETGNDYAVNRYHQPGMGRFLSPDPYQQSAGPSDPGSWNRYAYVGGDPINYNDPSGREECDPAEGDDCNSCVDDGTCNQSGPGGNNYDYSPNCTSECDPIGVDTNGNPIYGADGSTSSTDSTDTDNEDPDPGEINAPGPLPSWFYPKPPTLTTTCTGSATFSAIGPGQANGPGAFSPWLTPSVGTVAIGGPGTFGLDRHGVRLWGSTIRIAPIGINPILTQTGGPLPPYTIGDNGDINIRNSTLPRFDIYRWNTLKGALNFGKVTVPTTITFPTVSGAQCPQGFTSSGGN